MVLALAALAAQCRVLALVYRREVWMVVNGDLNSRDKTLVLWGGFDVTHIVWLVYAGVSAGKIPYYSDFLSSLRSVAAYGGVEGYVLASLGWLMEASIFLSAGALLMRRPIAILICWIQLPFRLLLAFPSISVIPIFLGFFENYSLLVAFALIVLSEVVKAYTLWRVSSR